jgi:hypothetical protein
VPLAVGEPVADRHGNIGAVIGRPAAPTMILSFHSRGISEAAGASPSEGGLMRTRSQDDLRLPKEQVGAGVRAWPEIAELFCEWLMMGQSLR